MKVKEKIIRDSIAVLEKEVAKLKYIVFGSHLSDLMEFRRVTLAKCGELGFLSRETSEYLEIQEAKEKEILKMCNMCTSGKYTKRLVAAELELCEYKNELANFLSRESLRDEIKKTDIFIMGKNS